MNGENIKSIGAAIYKINIHTKTASNPEKLYCLKNAVINKLLQENKAIKLGLHYRPNPKYSYQKSDVLIAIDSYLFHIPITKEDSHLPHLGSRDNEYRNPKTRISLKAAIQLLENYAGITVFPKDLKEKKRPRWAVSSYLDSKY
jgi:hypothetical protein